MQGRGPPTSLKFGKMSRISTFGNPSSPFYSPTFAQFWYWFLVGVTSSWGSTCAEFDMHPEKITVCSEFKMPPDSFPPLLCLPSVKSRDKKTDCPSPNPRGVLQESKRSNLDHEKKCLLFRRFPTVELAGPFATSSIPAVPARSDRPDVLESSSGVNLIRVSPALISVRKYALI